MKAKVWLISWLIIVVSALCVFGFWVFKIDPFFHYHKPDLEKYFYALYNQRSQNDGISKHFDYDTLITGTSMTENFRTSEVDSIFECNSIKVAYSGGTYKEINDNIDIAIKSNSNLKRVIRCLDMGKFGKSWDDRRTDLGEFPTYLYDSNPFNDVKYLLNRDIIFGRAYQMTVDNNKENFKPGITSFDDYSRWQQVYTFGIKTVKPDGLEKKEPEVHSYLSDDDKAIIKKNIEYNVLRTADENPDVEFYYFYSPYSIAWWAETYNAGNLYRQLEMEKYVTELIVPHKNIHLFSFNNRTDIITDLNNYKDSLHYATWVNSLMLKWMHDGDYQLTEDNYQEYLEKEYEFYTAFDYGSVNNQEDYEADFYAAALLNKELTGIDPMDILNDNRVEISLNGAECVRDGDTGRMVVDCYGTLARETEDLAEYIRDKEYIGAKFSINMDEGYNYLSFCGKKIMDHGRLTACAYDSDGILIGKIEANYTDLDNEIHHYVMDLSTARGVVTIVLNGGYIDSTGSDESHYQLSEVFMY